jgi:hypothetical protein
MALKHFRSTFDLNVAGAASGEAAATILTTISARGTGDAGFAEFLTSLETVYPTTHVIYSVAVREETRHQLIVGDFA